MLPLTTDKGFRAHEPGKVAQRGAIFRIARRGDEYDAAWIGPLEIYPCISRDAAEEKALAEALARELPHRVRRLYRTADIPDEQCWLRGKTWSLAFEPTEEAPSPKRSLRAKRSNPDAR
jgi:protein-L-isoaspartate(D-aspartate) O-methyltransferase